MSQQCLYTHFVREQAGWAGLRPCTRRGDKILTKSTRYDFRGDIVFDQAVENLTVKFRCTKTDVFMKGVEILCMQNGINFESPKPKTPRSKALPPELIEAKNCRNEIRRIGQNVNQLIKNWHTQGDIDLVDLRAQVSDAVAKINRVF
jgi:hypothetical protein